MLVRDIEQIVGRNRVGPDDGEARLPHRRQIALDPGALGKPRAVAAGSEGPVGDPPELEPLPVEREELPVDLNLATRDAAAAAPLGWALGNAAPVPVERARAVALGFLAYLRDGEGVSGPATQIP